MKKNILLTLAAILLSFFTYLTFNILNLPIGYWQREGVIALIAGFTLFKTIEGKVGKKIFLSIGSVVLGFLITIIYSTWAHDVAMFEICNPAIEKKYNLDLGRDNGDKDPMGKNGYLRSWYQHSECENNIMPFPWGKEAKFSDIPPGFIPVESSSTGTFK